MAKNIIIYGVGNFAQYVAYLFENDSPYTVIGYCVEKEYFEKSGFQISRGLRPLYKFEELTKKVSNPFSLFIAVGNNQIRARLYNTALLNKINMGGYISSKAVIWEGLKAEKNIFIGEGSIIQPMVNIKENTHIIGGRIGHHSTIGKHVLISGSTIGGNTKIGDYSFLGLNAAISQNLIIGENNIIGMNATIDKNTAPNSVYTTSKNTKLRKVKATQISKRTLT